MTAPLPKKKAPFVRFVNLYAANEGKVHVGTNLHRSRSAAIRTAGTHRIATLKITTTVEVV